MFALGIFGALASLFHWNTVVQTPDHGLSNLKKTIPTIVIDMKYATKNNFTGKVLYPSSQCFLLNHVALALADVQNDLNTQGFGLKVWDAYRPFSVQQVMWDAVKDTPNEKYVANPSMGGKHTRGTAVDVTLVYLKTGHEVEMPTGFDDFTERASRTSTDCPYRTQVNRRLLTKAMETHGFVGLPHEWWHFDYQDWQEHLPLDIRFDEL